MKLKIIIIGIKYKKNKDELLIRSITQQCKYIHFNLHTI